MATWLGWAGIATAADPAPGKLRVELAEEGKRQPNGIAEVGDTFRLRYRAPAASPAPVAVRLTTATNMMPYSLDGEDLLVLRDDGQEGDAAASDGLWSRDLVVGPDALELVCPAGGLLAGLAGTPAAAALKLPFACEIRTGWTLGFASDYAICELSVRHRLRWLRETKGENLALGRPVKFSLQPEYDLTSAGGTDLADLTDGKLSGRADDKIWFDAAAVGWYEGSRPTQGVNILIDLGAVQPVGKVVARFLGGGEQASLVSPAEFAVVVSEDGKTFYQVANLLKLMPAESNRAGEPGNYYLEEQGVAYTFPFAFPLQVRARYVGLAVKGATDCVFCDEIAVLKGDFPPAAAAFRPEQAVPFVTAGVIFGPRKPVLAISTNMLTPNFFRVLDCRPPDRRPAEARCVIELPAAVSILPTEAAKEMVAEAFTDASGAAWRRWRFPMPTKEAPYHELYRQPLYLKVAGELPPAPKAVFYVESPGFAPNRVTVPLLTIEIPQVPRLEGFHVSLAWMTERYALDWPDFLANWRHLGFDTVSTFPYWWHASDVKPYVPKTLELLDRARAAGFKVLQNDSPFHMMLNRHPNEPEIFSQLPAGPSKNPCPAYRGRFYQEEIARVGDLYEQSRPDLVFYDIELWRDGAMEANQCARCQEWQRKSGEPMAKCLEDMGTQMLADMSREIRARAAKLSRKPPVFAMYDLRAAEEVYQMISSFARVYPDSVQWSQPSLYCLNRLGYAHESMRAELKALAGKKGVIVPWLTTGTYGDAEPWTVEALVLESFLNGAAGITYFQFTDFDTALDFQAHAKALAAIAPYQALLREGRPCEVAVAAELATPRPPRQPRWKFWRRAPRPVPGAPVAGVLTSAWWNGTDEMLLLIGNYSCSKTVRVSPTLPFARLASVTNASTGEKLDPELPFAVEVPGPGFRLLHTKGQAGP